MRKTSFVLILIVSSFVIFGCGSDPQNNGNIGNSAADRPTTNTNNPLVVVTPTPELTTNNAPTLSPVYKAYCAAWDKKDQAALRRLFSSATLAKFEKLMKADRETDIFVFIGEQVGSDLCEVRNEQISGDRGVAEIRTRSYPNGAKLIFVRENGDWKLTDESPVLDSVRSAPLANSNSARK